MGYGGYDAIDYCDCGRTKKAAFNTCWKCKQAALEQQAFRQGYEAAEEELSTAYDRGFAAGVEASRPPKELLKRLIQLCHPDKHDGSKTATEVTQFLLSLRW